MLYLSATPVTNQDFLSIYGKQIQDTFLRSDNIDLQLKHAVVP